MDQADVTRPRSHWGGYRVVSLLLLVFFLSPTDPVFMLLVPLGAFFVFFGGSTGIKLTGAVVTALAFLVLAPWQEGSFLVVYVTAASITAALILMYRGDLDECFSYLAGTLAGCLTAAAFLSLSDWAALVRFEEKLRGEILEAGRQGLSSGFYSFMGTDTTGYTQWLESGVEVFLYLAPGTVVLMTVAAFYLAATLTRSSSLKSAEQLPEEVRFADFRFNDHLLWLFSAGLLFFLAPFPVWVKRIGANAAFVMAAIVLLRGIAVWVAFLGRRHTSPLAKAGFVLAFLILLPPIAAGLAIVLGLADIWIDVRQLWKKKGAA